MSHLNTPLALWLREGKQSETFLFPQDRDDASRERFSEYPVFSENREPTLSPPSAFSEDSEQNRSGRPPTISDGQNYGQPNGSSGSEYASGSSWDPIQPDAFAGKEFDQESSPSLQEPGANRFH
jgi:hypothetical protein